MGAPNITTALKDNKDAIDAVNKACEAAAATLMNSVDLGETYINNNTKGIVQTLRSNSLWYSKFSEDFSLQALDKIIDDTVNLAVDAIKAEAGNDSPDLAAKAAQDIGALVKGVLSLAACSSSTEQNLQVTFSYIVAGKNNFAVYYAYNSTTVDAKNVWGSKDINVIANTYIVAQVNPNPDITRAQILQKDLDTLYALNDKYDDALVAATSQDQVDALDFRQKAIAALQAKIKAEMVSEKKLALAAMKQ